MHKARFNGDLWHAYLSHVGETALRGRLDFSTGCRVFRRSLAAGTCQPRRSNNRKGRQHEAESLDRDRTGRKRWGDGPPRRPCP
jgi:hypothetical protein